LARPQCDTPLEPCLLPRSRHPSTLWTEGRAQGPGWKALTCPYTKNHHHFLCLLIVRIVIVNEYVIDWLNCIQFWTIEKYWKKIKLRWIFTIFWPEISYFNLYKGSLMKKNGPLNLLDFFMEEKEKSPNFYYRLQKIAKIINKDA